jgi:2-polyprenyl-6-methoxyphenol hydroxylase-like FAD-dependent oxidoreductase
MLRDASIQVAVHWKHKLLDIDIASQRCTFERTDGEALAVNVQKCVGADGNYSKVRRVCEEKTGCALTAY